METVHRRIEAVQDKAIVTEARTVPVAEWGRDHWSLLGYIGTRIIDHDGTFQREHLRCNIERHPGLAPHTHRRDGLGPCPATRLQAGKLEEGHDDWDCFYDMVAAGVFTDSGTGIEPVAVVTKKGTRYITALMEWKLNGGSFSTFALDDRDDVDG